MAPTFALDRLALLALAALIARHLAQSQLAQRPEVSRLEKILERILDLRGGIDLALAQALAQRFDRDVNVDYLIGTGQERIRHRLAHLDPGDPLDHRRDALQVLHVERGYYVDPRGEQLFDVLVALGMAAAGRVGVCQFVDNYVFRLARQNAVDVHLLKRRAAVLDLAQRHLLEIPD